MNPKDKLCADCWRRGTEAMQKQNWDYAIEMFGTCVNIKPENKVYRQTLRGCLQRKYDNNKTGAGGFAKTKLMGIRGRIKKARAKEDWDEMDKAAEEGLKLNPWDVGLNVDLGESAQKRDFMEVAEYAYKSAFEADPKNKEIALKYVEILKVRANYTDANKVLTMLCRVHPDDMQLQRLLTQTQTTQVTEEGGFDDAESTRDVRAKSSHQMRAGESVAPGQSEEDDLRHAVRKEPDKIEHLQKLAAYYRKERKLDQAREILQKALEMSGGDYAYREQLEDVELDMLRKNRELAKEAFDAKPGDATADKNYKDLERDLVKRELEVYLSREDRYPKDLKLKMEIALRYMRFQKWTEAIPRLQKAAQDVRVKAQALAHLGMCLYKDGKASLARGQLERAIPELDYDKDPKLFKDAHYNLGRILEELGDPATAEKHYGEILVVDYEYRDARQRLEKLQSGDASGE
jgi:tetratricopeptide (TPR) repeat protein